VVAVVARLEVVGEPDPGAGRHAVRAQRGHAQQRGVPAAADDPVGDRARLGERYRKAALIGVEHPLDPAAVDLGEPLRRKGDARGPVVHVHVADDGAERGRVGRQRGDQRGVRARVGIRRLHDHS
jgi:hypothetical protein